jgi:tRNA 2-thiouridine synthesizing protein B
MAVLHTINKSPFERHALTACLRVAQPGAGVLLIEDGVYAVRCGTKMADIVREAMRSLSFYALGPDLQARGVMPEQVINGVRIVDYDGFVDLTIEYHCVQAWL